MKFSVLLCVSSFIQICVMGGYRALQVRPANWVSVDIPALLDHQVSRAWLDPLERKEPRVTLVPLAALEKMDLLV